MKTTAMTAEERVRYMTQAPVRRLILEMSAPTVILCTMLLQTIGMAWQASVVAAARQGLFLIPVVFILPNLLGQRNRSAGEKSIATSYRTEESPEAEEVSGSS